MEEGAAKSNGSTGRNALETTGDPGENNFSFRYGQCPNRPRGRQGMGDSKYG